MQTLCLKVNFYYFIFKLIYNISARLEKTVLKFRPVPPQLFK